MLGGVKACSSAWLPLLLKPAPWKQEHTGHVRRKDFAPPRLIFCYLGKAAIIVKNDSFLSQVFFSSCPDGKGKSSTTNCYPEQDCRHSPDFFRTHIHSFLQGLGLQSLCPTFLFTEWDQLPAPVDCFNKMFTVW